MVRMIARVKACALLAVLALWVTSPLAGQERGAWSVEAQMGPAIPAGALADATDVGLTAGGSVGYQFHPNFGWRAGVEGIWLNDTRDAQGVVPSPNMSVLHVMTGPEVVFPRPSYQYLPMTFRLFAAAGIASIDATDTFSDGSSVAFDHTYFAVSFGGAAGYQVTPTVNIFVDGRGYLLLFDEQDTAAFADRSPSVDPFSEGWVVPLTVGVRLTFQP